jgi:hypothetical protein
MCVSVRYGMYEPWRDICSSGAGVGIDDGTEDGSVRRQMTDWIYGSDAGDAYGSPGVLRGNLRDNVEVKDLRKKVAEAG